MWFIVTLQILNALLTVVLVCALIWMSWKVDTISKEWCRFRRDVSFTRLSGDSDDASAQWPRRWWSLGSWLRRPTV